MDAHPAGWPLSWFRLPDHDDRISVTWFDTVNDTVPADYISHGQGFARRTSVLSYEQASICGLLVHGYDFAVVTGTLPDKETLQELATDLDAEASETESMQWHDHKAECAAHQAWREQPNAESKAFVEQMARSL